MEQTHKKKLTRKFRAHLARKPIISLGILDEYDYMQPELVDLLKSRVLARMEL